MTKQPAIGLVMGSAIAPEQLISGARTAESVGFEEIWLAEDYFFTGGVGNAEGDIESRRNVYLQISNLVEKEDKKKPLSDTALTRLLQEQGLQIARRTVTKYREQENIPASRLRRSY